MLKETSFLSTSFLNNEEIIFENKMEIVKNLYPKVLGIKDSIIKVLSENKENLFEF